jgi:hypothetical protein
LRKVGSVQCAVFRKSWNADRSALSTAHCALPSDTCPLPNEFAPMMSKNENGILFTRRTL